MLTLEKLKQILDYDPESGLFTWKISRNSHGGRIAPGMRAGHIRSLGYRIIGIDGKTYTEHRLAWFYMNGKFPIEDIDHKDRDKSNNKWSNLRYASRRQNSGNSIGKKKNWMKGTSRYKSKWVAQIQKEGKNIYLGIFKTQEDAHAAYCKAAGEVFGEFARGSA